MWILARNKVQIFIILLYFFWLHNKTKYTNLVIFPFFFLAIENFQNYCFFESFNLAFWRNFVMKKIVGSKHFAMDLIWLWWIWSGRRNILFLFLFLFFGGTKMNTENLCSFSAQDVGNLGF
jgi:hypothetical protein